MNKYRIVLSTLVASILFVGCAPKTDAPEQKTKNTPVSASNVENDGAKPLSRDQVEATNKPSKNAPVASPKIAENLKHEGYEYFGLSNPNKLTLTMSLKGTANSMTGYQTTKETSATPEKATYLVEYSGNPALSDKMEYIVTPKGVFATRINDQVFSEPQLQLPAKLTAGATWTNKNTFTKNGKTVESQDEAVVVGPSKVTTSKGTFDAILVKSNGTIVTNGDKAKVQTSYWFVKGIGPAKVEMVQTPDSGKPSSIVVELNE